MPWSPKKKNEKKIPKKEKALPNGPACWGVNDSSSGCPIALATLVPITGTERGDAP
jgi:hypothetical protein